MSVFLVLILALSAVGTALLVAMYVRDKPILGVLGLMVMDVTGGAAAVYGALDSF
jgi:hypothetical protein